MIDISSFLLAAVIVCWHAQVVLPWNEKRTNLVIIEDPFYDVLPVIDASWPVGIISYTLIGVFICNYTAWDPYAFAWSLILMLVLRSIVLWMHPFRTRPDMIPLRDVVVECILDVQEPLRNDCSFSGHCATLSLLGFLWPTYLSYYLMATLIMAVYLVISMNHYSADCLLAPFVSYACVNMSLRAHAIWEVLPWWIQLFCFMPFLHYIVVDYYNKDRSLYIYD